MTDSRQAQRGWFSSWREHGRARRQQVIERQHFEHVQACELDGVDRRSRLYGHEGAGTYWMGWFGGGDGGGCSGDGGGGGG